MSQPPYVIDEMISAKSIAARIEALSRQIHQEFDGTDKLVVVGLLRGSFVFMLTKKPARMKTIALLDKPARREVNFRADWTGFEIPDEFVVGYGIDYAQRDRNLPFIGKVRFVDT